MRLEDSKILEFSENTLKRFAVTYFIAMQNLLITNTS